MRKRFGEQAKQVEAAAERGTDSLLLRVVRNKWSWAIITGVLLAVWLLG